MNEHQPSVYELAADDIIAVLTNEDEAWLTLEEKGLRPAHMPTQQHRAALNAILELRRGGFVLSDTVILERSGAFIDLRWICERMALYDQTRTGSVFVQNIDIVRKHGLNEGMQRVLGTAIQQLQQGKKSNELILQQTVDILTTLPTGQQVSVITAGDIAADFRAFMNSAAPPMLSTGLDWTDEIAGGFEKHMLWWIAGAYKGRKTSLLFNFMLSALLQGASVEFMSREMPRRRVAANMISMLAIAYLMRKEWFGIVGDNKVPLNAISGVGLMRARKNYRKWDKRKVEAIDYGIDTWARFESRMRVYDTAPDGGALSDWASVDSRFKQDKAKYGTPDLLCADYLQLFGAPSDKTYEKTAYLASKFQETTQREDITTIVLAQKNEESIKSGAGSYSPGVKGGGDAAQTADYMLVNTYKQGDNKTDDTQLNIRMQLSRYGSGGENVDCDYTLHPATGLIIASNWIGKLAL